MKSILDRTFRYVPAAKTDVGKTIRRELARIKAEAEAREANAKEASHKLVPMKKARPA